MKAWRFLQPARTVTRTSLQHLNSTSREGLMIGCVEAQRSSSSQSSASHPIKKEAALKGGPKSREETPKEGCNIGTQRSMLRCTIYVALHNAARGRAVGHGPKLPGACRITAKLIVKL